VNSLAHDLDKRLQHDALAGPGETFDTIGQSPLHGIGALNWGLGEAEPRRNQVTGPKRDHGAWHYRLRDPSIPEDGRTLPYGFVRHPNPRLSGQSKWIKAGEGSDRRCRAGWCESLHGLPLLSVATNITA
jgi:hypothetical protein